MNTAVDIKRDPLQDFKDKLAQKVREDIASLLPEDVVSELVKKAVQEQFFTPRRKNVGNEYSPRWEEDPSWFVEAVAEQAEPILKAAVEAYIEANRGVIDDAAAQYLTPQNLTVLAVGRLSTDIGVALANLADAIRSGRAF